MDLGERWRVEGLLVVEARIEMQQGVLPLLEVLDQKVETAVELLEQQMLTLRG